MTKHLYILRHGETEMNRLGIVQGSGVDAPLNETGWWQAAAFFEKYQNVPFDAVFTSTLQRTRQTVESFIQKGIPWQQFAEINEMNWGALEGKVTTRATHEAYLATVNKWKSGELDAKLAGSESAAELGARIKKFVGTLRQRDEEYLLICSHGRALRCLISVLKNLPLTVMDQFAHTNTGLYKARRLGANFYIEIENDTSHLTEAQLVFHN